MTRLVPSIRIISYTFSQLVLVKRGFLYWRLLLLIYGCHLLPWQQIPETLAPGTRKERRDINNEGRRVAQSHFLKWHRSKPI